MVAAAPWESVRSNSDDILPAKIAERCEIALDIPAAQRAIPSDPIRRDQMGSDWLIGFWEFYVLATSKDISGQAPSCDSACSWQLYSAASLGDQATVT